MPSRKGSTARPRKSSFPLLFSGWLLLLLCLAGCAGYRLGPSNGMAAGSKSIQINLFRNDTLEPRLSEAIGFALRRTIQQDGTFSLDTKDEGDIVLTGVVVSFERSGLSFQPADILTVRDFSLSMNARVKAVERGSGKVLLDAMVSGRTTVRAGADLVSAERQAVPLVAQDLSRNLTSLLVDGKW